jgi:hypothetical protein
MVQLHSFAQTPVSPSPTLNKPHSVLHQVALPGLLKSPPAPAPALAATGIRPNGQAGFLPAQLVFLALPAAGVAPAHGEAQVTGVVMEVPAVLAVQVAQVVQVDSDHGEPKPAASTATSGQPGLLDGAPSLRGLAHGLAAAQPPPLLFLLPSPPPSQLVARLKFSPVPLSVSRL